MRWLRLGREGGILGRMVEEGERRKVRRKGKLEEKMGR
jgi:hypothetical protein